MKTFRNAIITLCDCGDQATTILNGDRVCERCRRLGMVKGTPLAHKKKVFSGVAEHHGKGGMCAIDWDDYYGTKPIAGIGDSLQYLEKLLAKA